MREHFLRIECPKNFLLLLDDFVYTFKLCVVTVKKQLFISIRVHPLPLSKPPTRMSSCLVCRT